ncbi:MAG: glycosyltransferase family 1 protein [Alphaproteobacteria bacterium]|nr:glycosyltransferase family 1 protein [Alphaproteobacteria bacterium]MDB5721622.1 glycosyltransferase family 1 protein [Alphaproteobacteria bacterium]
MRIVDVCAFYAPAGGGVKTYVERKLKAGAAAGHEVIIVAPGREDGTLLSLGSSAIVTLASPALPVDRRYRYFDDEPALHALLDRLRPDVIEASSPWASPSMVARWPGSALRSLVVHADPLSAYAYRWFGPVASRETIDRACEPFWRHLRNLDRDFDLVVSPSRSLGRRLKAGGLAKVTTIPMGVEPGIFTPARRSETLRARLLARCGLDAHATLLIGMGRHAPEKRWKMVIEAVAAAGYERPVGLVLLGDGADRARVVRAAANNPHIQLLAPVHDRDELATILASADALIHGCEAETFCLAAAEAKASGLPLIVPDDGGAFDQLVEGQGIAYAAARPLALSHALSGFLSDDPVGHRLRAAAAAGEVPGMDAHFDRLFGAYRQLASYSRAA